MSQDTLVRRLLDIRHCLRRRALDDASCNGMSEYIRVGVSSVATLDGDTEAVVEVELFVLREGSELFS